MSGLPTATTVQRRHGRARARFTSVAEGDLRISQPAEVVEPRRAAVVDLPWTWLHQVHGGEVVVVERPGQHAGVDADAAVTTQPGAALAIHTADCAPVALLADEAVGAVHAGWRGVEAGVVEAAVTTLRQLGATSIHAVVGPCIHPECYEFGETELATLADRYGPTVRSLTAQGTTALDLPAAVTAALGAAGVDDISQVLVCTACDDRFFSHRARADTGRQAMVVWLEDR